MSIFWPFLLFEIGNLNKIYVIANHEQAYYVWGKYKWKSFEDHKHEVKLSLLFLVNFALAHFLIHKGFENITEDNWFRS